jgi:hypothetical protein
MDKDAGARSETPTKRAQRAVKRRIVEIDDGAAHTSEAKRRRLEGKECAPIEAMPPEVIRRIFCMLPHADKRDCMAASKRIFMNPCRDLRPPVRPVVYRTTDMLLLEERLNAPLCTGRAGRDSLVMYDISPASLIHTRALARVFDRFGAIIFFGIYNDEQADHEPIAKALHAVFRYCTSPPEIFFQQKYGRSLSCENSTFMKLCSEFSNPFTGDVHAFYQPVIDMTRCVKRDWSYTLANTYALGCLKFAVIVDATGVFLPDAYSDFFDVILKTLRRSLVRCIVVKVCLRLRRFACIAHDQLLANLHQSADAVFKLLHETTDCIQRTRDMPTLSRAMMQGALRRTDAQAPAPHRVELWYEPIGEGLENDPADPKTLRGMSLLRTYTDFA